MKNRFNPFLGTLAFIVITQAAHAASVTWNVAGNGTWDTATGNWTGGSPTANLYANGDTANFTNTAGGTITLSGTIAPLTTNVSAASGTYTFSGAAITTGTLVKSGGGTLQLNASNSYAGGTTLNAGKLDINHATALGNGLLTINNDGSRFDNTSGGLITIANNITSTHNTVFEGTRALTTSGTYTYHGTARTLTVNGSGTLTVGALAVSGGTGPGLLRKHGAGTLAITGASTAHGIEFGASSGVVIAGNKSSLGTGNLAVIDGGSGTLQASTTLTGANKFTNGVTLTGTGALTLSGSNDFEIGGAITSTTNTSKLTKAGVNTVTFSGANSYSGGTTISGGTLALSGSGTLGATTGALTFSGGGAALNIGSTTQTVASVMAGDTATNISANITGVGGTLNASGNLVSQGWAGNGGNYSANPTLGINTGMVVSGDTLIGRSSLAISGGTYSTSRFTSNALGEVQWGRLAISGNSVVTATNGVDGTYGTSGNNGTNLTFQLELNGGTLSTPLIKVANRDNSTAGPDGDNDAHLIWNGGVVKATGANNANFVQVYGDSVNGARPTQATYVSSGGAIIDTNGLNIGIQVKLLANPFSAGGGLTLNDTAATKGTLTLSGANTYTGNTTITAGTLALGASGSIASSATISVASGATFDVSAVSGYTLGSAQTLSGDGAVNGAVVVNGRIAPGTGGIGTLTVNKSVTWNAGTNWQFDLNNANDTSDKLVLSGSGSDGVFTKGTGGTGAFVFDFMGSQPFWNTTYTLATFASSTFSLSDFNLASSIATLGSGPYSTSSFTLNPTSLTFTAIPEPTSALAGLLLTAGLLRRRRK